MKAQRGIRGLRLFILMLLTRCSGWSLSHMRCLTLLIPVVQEAWWALEPVMMGVGIEEISCSCWHLDTELSNLTEVTIPTVLYEPISVSVELIKFTFLCASFLSMYMCTVSHYYPVEYLYV